MKITNLLNFQEHLKKTAKFQGIYLFIIPDPFERGYYLKRMENFLLHFAPQMEREFFKWGEKEKISFSQTTLFKGERLVTIDQIEKLKKKDFLLEEILKGSLGSQKVILGGSAVSLEIYQMLKKRVICLDLTEEKPWDRKVRWMQEAIKIAKEQKKILEPEIAKSLTEQVDNFAFLVREIEKICCFLGKRSSITQEDVQKVGIKSREANFWQIAEIIVWEKGEIAKPYFRDLSDWLGLIAQIRIHLRRALEICEGSFTGILKDQKEKNGLCQKLGERYFRKKLLDLFDLEVKAKSYGMDLRVLWDLLLITFQRDR